MEHCSCATTQPSWSVILLPLLGTNSGVCRRRSIRLTKRDVTNHQLVAANKGNIVIAKPKQVMTKQEALVHAAWIVALADDKDEFERILEDVMAM